MRKTKVSKGGFFRDKTSKALAIMGLSVMMLAFPLTAYADNTANHSNNFTNPNWQATHHADDWNWQHNWAYQAPAYQFETTFRHDHWGRPTSSSVTPQNTQNVRRDRHAAVLPPSHGSVTGFYSGEFATNQANPFAPRYNNNPNASHAVGIPQSVFATRPGEAGVNVRPEGNHTGGFLASTSVTQGGGGSALASGNTSNPDAGASWTNPGNQVTAPNQPQGGGQGNVTITHTPMPGAGSSQAGNQANRTTTVVPFSDGTIGRITIPALNNRVAAVRSGTALATLDNYVGHFASTSEWDGNIGLASHNRGRGSFFAGIWTLQHGDRIFYETTMGIRVFEVVSVSQIQENDLSNLNHTHENFLTLVTCVYGQPSLRWSVRAREVV